MGFLKKTWKIWLGPLLFLIPLLISIPGFSFNARISIGLILWMGAWWITMPVAPGVTALLPILINAIFQIAPMELVTKNYFSEIVILLLGADLITLTWSKTGVDQRLAMKALGIIGTSLKQQIVVWFLLSAFLSAVLPNAVVCAILTPIAVSMLRFSGETEISTSKVSLPILATIAWGAGIGGLITPLGGAMNLVAINYFEELTGTEFLYSQWLRCMIPFFILLAVAYLIYLMSRCPKGASIRGSKEFFNQQARALPPISRDEIISIILFLCPMILSFLRELFADALPGMKPAYIFLLFGVIGFLLFNRKSEPFITWREAEKGVIWGLLFLFGGGLALGALITNSGATDAIAEMVRSLNLTGGFGTILVFVSFTVLLAEISSNTAAAAIAVPVIIGVVQVLGLDAIPYIYITAVAFNCANILPTSIRSIPIGYGLPVQYMSKNGLILSILGILLISGFGYIFLLAWQSGIFFPG